MPIAPIKERTKMEFAERTPLLFLTTGNHVVRFLPPEVVTLDTHFIMGKYSVACLGQDCPICKNNQQIILENPKKFRDVKGWSSRTTRYIYTVIDRSPVKVCPNCGNNEKMVNGVFPSQCTKCEAILSTVKATKGNQVKLLPASETVAVSLNSVNDAVTGQDGMPIGLEKYDVILTVVGEKQDKKVTPIPNTNANDVVEYDASKMPNPRDAVMTFNAEELNDLLRGVSLKDVFAARRKSTPAVEVTPEPSAQLADMSASISSAVSKLF